MILATDGSAIAARIAALSSSTPAGGVLPGAKNMPNESGAANPGTTSFTSGVSGNSANGLLPVKASARTVPSFNSPITDGGVTNMTSMLPPSSAVMTSDAPL